MLAEKLKDKVYNLIFKHKKWTDRESISKETEDKFKLTSLTKHLKAA